jgi:uncharacterized membrane protein
MTQLRITWSRFKTEVDKRSECEFILRVAENSKPQCQICHKATSPNAGTPGELLRPSLLEFIQKRVPSFDPKGFICLSDLGQFRRDYVREVLEDEIGELTALDQEVIDSLQQHEILSENVGKEFEQELTFGEHLSDRIAALQAPVIMMSQNRTEARDRARAENDYKVNLKAELEIRHLHEKLDHLLRKQYNRLFEIQQIQIELLEELGQKRRVGATRPAQVAASETPTSVA